MSSWVSLPFAIHPDATAVIGFAFCFRWRYFPVLAGCGCDGLLVVVFNKIERYIPVRLTFVRNSFWWKVPI